MRGFADYEKMTRIQLREQGKEAVMVARSRAEDRVILSSCFEQNAAKLIGVGPSSKQRMTREGGPRSGRRATGNLGSTSPRNSARSTGVIDQFPGGGSGGGSMEMVTLDAAPNCPPVTLGAPLPPAISLTPRPRTRPGGFRVSRATQQAIQ